MSFAQTNGCDLYFELPGESVPILLVPPSGATSATWGKLPNTLAGIRTRDRVRPEGLRAHRRRSGAFSRTATPRTLRCCSSA